MHHRPRKRFGQNFLRDDSIIESIARAISPAKGDHLVEIGPGEGSLTQALITTGCQLDAIELDRDLRTKLLSSFSTYPGFTLHSADALKFNFASLISQPHPLRIVGNLPYNISTPLIFRLLDEAKIIVDMHFMLQLEVADRLAAQPGTRDWGRLSIMAQFRCQIEKLFEVPPHAFYPPPKVQSAVVRLTPHASPQFPETDVKKISEVVTQAFSQRRKTLRNNFKGIMADADFEQIGINPACRAEALSIADFVAISKRLRGSKLNFD